MARNLSIAFLLSFGLSSCSLVGGGETMRSDPLRKFFEDNYYNLVYPAEKKMEPGEIRPWDKKRGLSHDVVAFKDQCFQDLQPRPNEINFGRRTVAQSGGIEFLLGLNQALIPYEAELKGQFEKDVEMEIYTDVMPTQVVSKVDLENCISKLLPGCMNKIGNEDNVIISQVVQSQNLTFKFKGVKKGGLDIIFAKLLKVGFKCSKKDEETIELITPTPMIIAYTGYQYKKGQLISSFKDAEKGILESKLEVVELDDITMRIAGP